ncbi:MAG: DUF4290 domain-containing protein [Muribaculaceae bacterium]|nr:DUF4290 domain-containing protein [Muribaculaceae bacterium]MDE6447388.1 DUF4290 domain-containing protein [Muribaculaceae bacterium]
MNQDILTDKSFKFIPYNTGMPQLPLPEYGRNIQNMVDYCVEIPDREERTICAYSIVGVMRTLFPQNVGENGDMKKFWDHLNIMARFELDIDFPCEVVTADSVNPRPAQLNYEKSAIRNRQYGRSLENIVKIVAMMEEGEERQRLISMIAHQMKKLLLTHNPDGVDNGRILRDLYNYSEGKIDLDPNSYVLHEFCDVTPVAKNNKKKKKNRNMRR